jgi:hypothetical protein
MSVSDESPGDIRSISEIGGALSKNVSVRYTSQSGGMTDSFAPSHLDVEITLKTECEVSPTVDAVNMTDGVTSRRCQTHWSAVGALKALEMLPDNVDLSAEYLRNPRSGSGVFASTRSCRVRCLRSSSTSVDQSGDRDESRHQGAPA